MAARDGLAKWQTVVLLLIVVAVVAGLGSLLPPAPQRTVTEALIMLVVVVGMFIFIGNSGVVSFGHVAFMALGGYMSAILTMTPARKDTMLDLPAVLEQLQLPPLVAAPLAGGFAALVALAVGWPLMRLRGVALPMASFALLAITHVVASNWSAVTAGRQALVGLPRYTGIWTAAAFAGIAIVVAFAYKESRRGLLLRSSREDEVAAAATGIGIDRERLLAFALSAFFVGLGGVLFSHLLGTVTANTFYLDITFVTLSMLIVGGMHSLTGAVVGVLALSLVSELLRGVEKGFSVGGVAISAPPGLQEIALAVLMGAVLIWRPAGLTGGAEATWRGLAARLRLPARSGVTRSVPERGQ